MDRQSSGTVLQYIRRIVRTDSIEDAADSELLERFIAGGDEEAFALLVRRHGPMVLGVCQRILVHVQDVEDAFQATFMVLVRKASRISRRELLAPWLYGVALRTAVKARANAAKRRSREALLPDLSEAEAPAESAWKSVRYVLDEEVGRLPSKYRTPFTLCYLQGLTNEEAARQLGCPKGTLQSRLAWARDRLRHRLTRRGVVLSAGLFSTLVSQKTASALVPCALADRTVRMALAFGGWQTAAGGTISASAAHLAQGVLHAMFLAKLKIVVAIVLAGILLGAGASIWMRQTAAAQPIPDVRIDDDEKPAKKEPAKARRHDDRFKAEAVVQKSLQTGATPHVVVETFNGPIDIKEGGNRKVDVTVTKSSNAMTQQEADDELANVEVSITQEGDTVRVTAKRKQERRIENGGSGARAELQVPSKAVLELRSSNGHITVEGGKGGVHAGTSNGPITVANGAGKMDLRTSNGKIQVKADQAMLTGRTSNGSIRFEGSLAGGDHSLITSNGSIHVFLPENAHLKVDADTSNGSVTTAFSSSENRVRGRRLRLQTNIGGDDPSSSLKLHTSNGTIALDKIKE